MLTNDELKRYARHFPLPDFGVEGQEKLRAGSVLVVGAGGLGSPVLLYLAAAGVGRIGIIDDDVVDETNLQRQVLYTTKDIGRPKVEVAAEQLQALNPHIRIDTWQQRLDKDNVMELIRHFDVIADGTDNFATRYLVNDACVLEGKVNVYASIFRYEGQVSVFNYPKEDGSRGVNYRDIFPAPPPPDMVPNCAEGGVLGVLPGIIGSMQANEVIKILSGVGEPLAGRLFLFDAAQFSTRVLNIPVNPELEITHLEWYDAYCNSAPAAPAVPTISHEKLRQWQQQGKDFQLIDVREPHEYLLGHLPGSVLIPLGHLPERTHQLATDKPIVFYCKSGMRSAKAVEDLAHQFSQMFSLEGGMTSGN